MYTNPRYNMGTQAHYYIQKDCCVHLHFSCCTGQHHNHIPRSALNNGCLHMLVTIDDIADIDIYRYFWINLLIGYQQSNRQSK